MYAAYLKETQNKEMLETPHGFLTYGFNCVPGVDFPHCYIEDLYVVPEMRKTHVATTMANEVARVAKERGVTKMLGSINAKSKTPDASLRVLQAYGMKLFSVSNDALWMIKDL